ncbi:MULTISPECIES: collagen binding domain-containing protein [unclassified Curtobacterium]|uniref:MSCRAMM family protein n=1 Tax=unclassified Curtobacterium TaxID=257496 RepID=UPI000F484852|nr:MULTISPECIES: carboxypeptidase regulatory-like domain-containing protein [unclassified Curtobacterium]ROQ07686.1 carboxypeptidase family protein [Curtobacterium sp. PhB171]ROQ23703.1 carboxypeptidase family protein [Curtobacterium sp. PhB170]ROS35617.1 carboxypeptidase family protein [Curtobacterium sp. PhB131]ROS69726.1 carboxypeptidase family protein [Curtobacterium sp. PhB141]
MRRWRAVTAGLTALALGAGLAIGGATSASAEPAGNWGTFTLSGASKAYTGTMTLPGFPATTFTSNSRQSTVISGASTWQSAGTPVGGVYGTSRAQTYMNQRPQADRPNGDSASTTTYTFDGATPGAQSWSFVLGDIDADQATISATVAGGGAATAEQLGYQGSYNSCSASSPAGWSCSPDPDGTTGQDQPTWDAATRTLTGNAAASDTAGASAWFTPTASLTSLTITYQQRSGFPVYQTWFANRTAAISGTATLDGTPIPGATVTVTAPRGTVYTTTTDDDGNYVFPQLPVIANYRVEITPPAGADGDAVATGVSLAVSGTPGGVDKTADFAFTSPDDTTSVIGTVTDAEDHPVANVPVVIDVPGGDPIETTTNSDGVYTASDLPADTAVEVSVAGEPPVTITTGDAGAAPVEPEPIIAPPAVIATITGIVSLDGTPVPAGVVVELLDESGAVVGSTTTDADGRYTFATSAGTYTVRTVVPAAGATGNTANTDVTATAGTSVTSDLPFETPAAPEVVTTDQPGTVVDTNGDPVAGVDVVATPTDPEAGPPVTVTTDDDGTFDLVDLQPTTEYTITVDVDGATPATVVTPEDGAATPLAFVVEAAVTPVPSPSPSAPTPSNSPTAVPTVPAAGGSGNAPAAGSGDVGDGGPLAYTGADLKPGLIAAGVLVLLGAALLTFRAVRNRRRSHLQD